MGVRFTIPAEGRNATEAFKMAVVSSMGEEEGISLKESYMMVDENWKSLKIRYSEYVQKMNEILRELSETPAKEYSRENFIEDVRKNGLPLWAFDYDKLQTKNGAVVSLRALAKSWREHRNNCKQNMGVAEIIDHLMLEMCDDRFVKPDSPAGCIDLTPKITGQRKPKKFLFFGLAEASTDAN